MEKLRRSGIQFGHVMSAVPGRAVPPGETIPDYPRDSWMQGSVIEAETFRHQNINKNNSAKIQLIIFQYILFSLVNDFLLESLYKT